MSIFQLIYRSFIYYRKSHLAIIIGVATSTMVLTGTLFVGDSIQSSLERSTLLRLGKTDVVFSGIDRYFRSGIADDLRKTLDIDVAPILQLDGIASAQGGKYKLNGVQIIGIDEHYSSFVPGKNETINPSKNEAYISENLAQRLQLEIGDSFLSRVEKASQIPKNAPFVSDANSLVSIRLKVGRILGPEELGRFNLKTSQTAPYNVFLPLSFLVDKMELKGKANRLLFSNTKNRSEEKIRDAISKFWTPEDMALEVFSVNDGKEWEIRSARVFMDDVVVNAAKKIDPDAKEILTYMVNSFRIGDKETPYSFISAGPFMKRQTTSGQDIVINSWMADDLDASVGDSIEIVYFVIGPLRKLTEERHWFTISDIVPIAGIYAEKDLMPNLPGLSDAGNCREWEAGVPVVLDKIRDKDEDYWKEYSGTPKAFISYHQGEKLWANRFGNCTAIRLSADDLSKDMIDTRLSSIISPENLGYSLRSVKEDGLTAARGGVDFSKLFMALSFFLLVAGLILIALLFNLHLDKRMSEIGTFKALGYPDRLIQKIVLFEGLLLAIPGVAAGGLLAVLYNNIIFKALNTVWYGIVRTSVLQEVVRTNTLLTGMGIALALVWMTIGFNVFKKLKISSSSLQKELYIAKSRKFNFWFLAGSWISGVMAIGLLVYEIMFGKTLNTGIFFSAGTLLLLAAMLFAAFIIRKGSFKTTESLTTLSLILKNLSRNSARSLRIIILFSLGTFVIISTGLNRKDLHSGSEKPTSGTGGFLFFMETTLPVLMDLNDREIQVNLGIEPALRFVQLRKSEGDDASCLNLNRVTAPRILGLPSQELKGRFSFIKSTPDLDLQNPWVSLKTELAGGVVPAIADQTVIQWGLGKKVGDTLIYSDELGQEMKLKLIGGLANSIFQGNVLIDEKLFLAHFPSSSGSHVFLVDGPPAEQEQLTKVLQRTFRNEGLEIEIAADRLATFNQIENTYLSIFLLLGGLAMILGTVGLGVSLARNILDRGQEIGILRAIGYQKSSILSMITVEHLILLLIGTLTGAITAFVATLPSLLSEFVQASWQTAILIISLIVLNGCIWIILITRNALHKNLLYTLRSE